MQTNTSIRIRTWKTIFQVTFYRTSNFCQLTSYLMVTSSHQVYLRLRVGRRERRDVGAVVGLHVLYHEVVDRGVADLRAYVRKPLLAEARVHRVEDERLLVLHQIVSQLTLYTFRSILHDSPIRFLHLSISEHIIQTGQRLACLGKNHQATDRSVQPMDYAKDNISPVLSPWTISEAVLLTIMM